MRQKKSAESSSVLIRKKKSWCKCRWWSWKKYALCVYAHHLYERESECVCGEKEKLNKKKYNKLIIQIKKKKMVSIINRAIRPYMNSKKMCVERKWHNHTHNHHKLSKKKFSKHQTIVEGKFAKICQLHALVMCVCVCLLMWISNL